MNKRCGGCFRFFNSDLGLCPYCGYEEGDPAAEPYFLYPGMVLNNRYVVGGVLGFGGFGVTYRAWDKNLNIIVAIKEYFYTGIATRQPGTQTVLIYAQSRRNEFQHFLNRFMDEARYTAKLGASNSNIVNVYEFFEANNTAYMVMEFLDGIPLNEYLKQNTMDIGLCVSIVKSICSALKTVHAEGIIHRDISPDNIMLCCDGKVKLYDFGAARFSKNEENQVMKLTQVMKPGFSPPEQYQSISKHGSWTDIYALGATLYYMITRTKPVESTNRIEEGKDNLVPPQTLRADIPDYINDTILRAMAVEMHLRFHAIDEFEMALCKEKKVLSVHKEKKRRKKNRVASLVSAALLIIFGVSAFSYYYITGLISNKIVSIEFWYAIPASDELAEAKNKAYQALADIFIDGFPGTDAEVKLCPFPQDEYTRTINDAYKRSALPHLFESAGLDETVLKSSLSVDKAVQTVDLTEIVFINAYNESFPDAKQFPLGFVAPIAYTNNALLEGEVAEDNNKELFLSGKSHNYVGSTADYYEIQDALPARYSISPVDDKNAVCMFSALVSIGNCDKWELHTVNSFLGFLLSENAQDYLHIQYPSGSLPLNKKALNDGYVAIYNEFMGFFNDIENYEIIIDTQP